MRRIRPRFYGVWVRRCGDLWLPRSARAFAGSISWSVVRGTTNPTNTPNTLYGAPGTTGTDTLTATLTANLTLKASAAITNTNAATRDPALQPFAQLSPWNYPLGPNATFAPIVFATGDTPNFFVDSGIGGGVQTPPGVYIAKTTDPVRTFNVNNFFGTNDQIASAYFGISPNNNNPTPNFSRHAPNNMTANTTDGMLVIIAPDHLVAMSGEGWNGFNQLPATGSLGTLTSGLTINEDLKGPGWNGTSEKATDPTPWTCIAINSGDEATPYPSSNPTSGSPFYSPGAYTTAAGCSLLGGMLRAGELKNGILHALQLGTSGVGKNKNAPGGQTFVWPATTSDGGGSGSGYGTSGNVYIGACMGIPPSVNLNARTWNHPEIKNLAVALQVYGGYVTDSGGGGGTIEVRTEVAVVLGTFNGGVNEIPNDAGAVADFNYINTVIQMVTNSYALGSGTTAFGVTTSLGGQPRTGYRVDGGDGTVSSSLLAPAFASQYGGGNGRPN